jgi:hypothetical protein
MELIISNETVALENSKIYKVVKVVADKTHYFLLIKEDKLIRIL